MRKRRLLTAALIAAAAACTIVPSAFGSFLIGRNASDVQLRVVRDHHQLKSLILFQSHGHQNIILAWGALNARAHPQCGKLFGRACGPRQVEMSHKRLHRSGHYAQRLLAKKDLCKRYDGPSLPYFVGGCKAPDHSYWATQQWIRLGPVCTSANKGKHELRLSHWSGPVAQLHMYLDWQTPHPHAGNPAHYTHLFGWYSYKGKPVYGLNWTGTGVPTDGYGRVIYIESHNTMCHGAHSKAHGISMSRWDNDESGLSKPIHGQFCHNYSPPGTKHYLSTGDAYRAIAMGPGVTPDVSWGPEPALDVFDPLYEAKMNALQHKLAKGSKFCNHIH